MVWVAAKLSRRKFGELTVVRRIGTNKNRKPLWLCRCSCGLEATATSVSLLCGMRTTCAQPGRHPHKPKPKAYGKGNRLRYTLREDAFSVWTPEAEYWAGFLCADGYIKRNTTDGKAGGGAVLRLALQLRDKGHVEKFRRFLGTSAPLKEYTVPERKINGKTIRDTDAASLTVYSVALVDALVSVGLTQPSLDRTIAEPLAKSPHFWRGVIDGDGSLMRFNQKGRTPLHCLSLVGGGKLVRQFAKFAENNGIPSPKIKPRGKIDEIPYVCVGARKLAKILYQTTAPSLNRKLAIAKEWSECDPTIAILHGRRKGASKTQELMRQRRAETNRDVDYICKNGHDTAITGRSIVCNAMVCHACRRNAKLKWRLKQRHGSRNGTA